MTFIIEWYKNLQQQPEALTNQILVYQSTQTLGALPSQINIIFYMGLRKYRRQLSVLTHFAQSN